MNYLLDRQLEMTKKIKRALIDVENNVLSSDLIDFSQIIEDTRKIKITDDHLTIDIDEKISIHDFKSICNFGAFIKNETLYLACSIPLVNRNTGRIFELIAIPSLNGGIATSQKISKDFVVTDKEMGKHFLISRNTLLSHTKRISNTFHWEKSDAWFSGKTCEIAIMNQKKNDIEKLCEKIIFKIEHHRVIMTQSDNEILVLTPRNTTGKFIGKEITKFSIDKSSKLTMKTAGKLMLDEFEIIFPERHSGFKIRKTINAERIDFSFDEF